MRYGSIMNILAGSYSSYLVGIHGFLGNHSSWLRML